MSVVQECGDVLQYKGGGSDLLDDTQEVGKQKIPLVRRIPLPHGAKTLARRSADEDLDLSNANLQILQDLISRHSGEVSAVVCAVREVPLVRCECSCVEVNGACEAKSGAGGAETHSSATTKKVDSGGLVHRSVS
jgi:hypothetical protein